MSLRERLNHILFYIATLLLFLDIQVACGDNIFRYSKNNTVIGAIKRYTIKADESLIEIARIFNLGYNEIVDANPGIDPFIPEEGKKIIIPTMWVLPDAIPRKGIVINLSEMRLYYFYQYRKGLYVRTFPVGIGDEGWDTPQGLFWITEKIENPSWHVPESIRKEDPTLPEIVPPGADNPLGTHALRLNLYSILIHGTDKPWSIGRMATHGCIRLYPEDIVKLFSLVKKWTKVRISREPVKIGVKGKRVYIEVHEDKNLKDLNYLDHAIVLLSKKNLLERVNLRKLFDAIKKKRGIPTDISDYK